jgi:hypothetical protein
LRAAGSRFAVQARGGQSSSSVTTLPPIAGARAAAASSSPAQQKVAATSASSSKYGRGVSPTRVTRARGGGASPASSASPAASASPLLSRAEPAYSSLLQELRSTRDQVEEEARQSSTLQAIANLGGTPEFRRTVTRIFANPEDADRISEEEMRRRQRLWDKLSKQQAQLDAEAEAAFATPASAAGGGGGGGGGGTQQLPPVARTGNVGADAVAALERDMAVAAARLAASRGGAA